MNSVKTLVLGLSVAFVTACGPAGNGGQSTAVASVAKPAVVALTVYKSPTCGCCGAWIDHLHDSGMSTETVHPASMSTIKQQAGVGGDMQSCHTAKSQDGYVFEGHVPATAIRDFLAKPPEGSLGLAVPGMPMGSPGMEVDDRFQPYTVFLLKEGGGSVAWRSYSNYASQF